MRAPALDRVLDAWLGVVAAWSEDQDPALLRAVLSDGLAESVKAAPSVSEDDRAACERALVRASGVFDPRVYTEAVPPSPLGDAEALQHFCDRGWRQLRNPYLGFDTWWYWREHLDPRSETINPLVHHLLVGRRAGLPTVPDHPAPGPGVVLQAPVRRACLFAAYDAEGTVPETTLAYVAELARHAEVYYLADCEIHPDELAKLDDITTGAWAFRHGAYDFGSYSRLARDLVGWDVLETYDEVVLVNDSAYLLRPLDEVFARMDARPCDWWGLHAVKRDLSPEQGFVDPEALDTIQTRVLGAPVHMALEHLHVSSYFVALRRPALSSAFVRRFLDSVVAQQGKQLVIVKYEIGLSQVLMEHGLRLDTFLDDLWPNHPMYSEHIWELLERGFPLIKRNLLAENTTNVPDLHQWEERVLRHVPGAAVASIERDLRRVADDAKLHRARSVRRTADGGISRPVPLSRAAMAREDARTPTFDHWWAFPVCAFDHTFSGNERAVFEEVRDDPSIKKVILTRSRRVEVAGVNVEVWPIDSPEGQQRVLRAGQIFIKHSPLRNVPYPLDPARHNFINLWHGIALKRFGTASRDTTDRRLDMLSLSASCRAVISSSAIDRLTMAAAFAPLAHAEIWPTGLPRNDFVTMSPDRLPPDLRAEQDRLREEVGRRRLVMFLPTFKNGQADAYYEFSPAEVERLGEWCRRHDVVLGVREHMADTAHTYSRMLAPLAPLDLSPRRYPNLEVLYPVADALVSDYSSCLVDFLLTGKPVVSFAYDLDRYAHEERGLFYDLDEVLPGAVTRTFEELAAALEDLLRPRTDAEREEYAWRRSTFFDHLDQHSARRVVQRVKALSTPEALP